MIIAMVGVGPPATEQEIVVRAWRFAGVLRTSRYRRTLSRLRRDGVVVEDERGLIDIAEPDGWIGRISREKLAVIVALNGAAAPLSHSPLYPVFPGSERRITPRQSPLATQGAASGTARCPGRPGCVVDAAEEALRARPSTASGCGG